MLVVSGRQDRICGYVDQFEAMTRYPHGTYIALDRAGHYLPFEQPALFAAALRSWLLAWVLDHGE
ncbi:MAG: alpha/beta hydrolase [Nocardioidaceae bacterium]